MDCIAWIYFCTGFRLLCETWEILGFFKKITYFRNMLEQAAVYGSVSLMEDLLYYPTSAFHSGLLY